MTSPTRQNMDMVLDDNLTKKECAKECCVAIGYGFLGLGYLVGGFVALVAAGFTCPIWCCPVVTNEIYKEAKRMKKKKNDKIRKQQKEENDKIKKEQRQINRSHFRFRNEFNTKLRRQQQISMQKITPVNTLRREGEE